METKSIQQFMNSFSVKMVVLSGLALLLLIPSFLIREIIVERITLGEKVKNELYSQWGNKQVVAGPVLNVPYLLTLPGEDNQLTGERSRVAHFLPESLQVNSILSPETRKRGIYKVVVYEGQISIKGTFAKPDVSQFDIPNARYNWDAAYFTIGISDMRGIKNLPELTVNGQKFKVEPGVADNDLFQSGITVKVISFDPGRSLNFEADLVLNGSEELSVEALGKTTKVTIFSGSVCAADFLYAAHFPG